MKTVAFALAFASIAAAGAAAAQPPAPAIGAEAQAPVVRYADLDLTREQGAQALVGRISQAAHAFCGPEPRAISLGEYMRYQACVAENAGAAVRRIDAPQVSAVFARTTRPMEFARR